MSSDVLARLPQVRQISVPSTLVSLICHVPSRLPRASCPPKKRSLLTKKEWDPHCQELWLKERQRLNPEDCTSCLRTLKVMDTGGCPACAALASNGKATMPHNDECRERTRKIIERTLTGKARMNAYKDRIAETERVKERKRARVERVQGMEHGNRDDEQVTVRHADASGGDIRENPARRGQIERHPRGKRGSEATGEDNRKLGTVRFEQEASASALQIQLFWKSARVGRGPYLRRS